MEYIVLEKNGIEYQIPCQEMELEIDKYYNAWKIVNQQPLNTKDYLAANMYARADTSQKRLGCGYSKELTDLFTNALT